MQEKSQNLGPQPPRLRDDLVTGADAISLETGIPVRRIYYLLSKRDIPAFKLRGRWHARRSSLLAHFSKLEKECEG